MGPPPATRTLIVMGTSARVVVVGGARYQLDYAQARLDDLERRWSPLLPTSELSRLNAFTGTPTIVSRDTFDLVAFAVESWYTTGGRFHPTGPSVHGWSDIRLCRATSTVTLPPGVVLALDGIARGRAADLVATELVERGARGARVDISGAVRVVGAPPGADGWLVDLPGARIAIPHGAVATRADVTVMADEAWRAEVLAEAAHFGMPVDHALAMARDGRLTWTGALQPYLV